LALVVVALVGKILAIILGIPLVIGIFIGYGIGKAAGRMSAHRDFEQYANLSAREGRPVLPPAPRRALRSNNRRAA
jgi:hypothetical protein